MVRKQYIQITKNKSLIQERAVVVSAAATFEDIDDVTLTMSTTGNGYHHEGWSLVRSLIDTDTKEMLTTIVAIHSSHHSSIHSSVSYVIFGFENRNDFDDEKSLC